jgi:hypothetical protein
MNEYCRRCPSGVLSVAIPLVGPNHRDAGRNGQRLIIGISIFPNEIVRNGTNNFQLMESTAIFRPKFQCIVNYHIYFDISIRGLIGVVSNHGVSVWSHYIVGLQNFTDASTWSCNV